MIILFASLTKSFELYMKKPLQFILSTLACLFFNLLVAFALIGIFLVFLFIMSLLKMTDTIIPFAITGAVLGLLFLYFSSAFNGALIKAYSVLAAGSKFTFMDMFNYAMGYGWTFFALNLLKLFILVLVNLPSALIYFFYLQANPIPYVDILLLMVSLFFTFVVEFLFYPSYIAAASYNTGVFRSLMFGFQLFKRKHIYAFGLFVLFTIVCFCNAIPLIQLVSYLVAFPIVYTTMVIFFQNYVGKSK